MDSTTFNNLPNDVRLRILQFAEQFEEEGRYANCNEDTLYAKGKIDALREVFGKDNIDNNVNINEKFKDLHHKLVNEIVDFCKKYNIEASSISLIADGLESSIEFGSWHPGTDSSFQLFNKNNEVIRYSI